MTQPCFLRYDAGVVVQAAALIAPMARTCMDGFSAALISFFGPFGLVVPAMASLTWVAFALGEYVFAGEPSRLRFLGGWTLVLALVTGGLQGALHFNTFTPDYLLGGMAAGVIGVTYATRRASGPALRNVLAEAANRAKSLDRSALPALLVAIAAVATALLSAYWLPIWQWDSLGYHLPLVNFVLQGGGLAQVPMDVPYLSTYPRNVELLFAFLRSVLPDDRLLDVGQVPLGVLGACAVYGVARELGAGTSDSTVAASAWLAVPAVYLQLPTNYIDVGSATYYLLASFLLLSAPKPATLLAAACAIGLFLGTKPSAPPAALLLSALLVWRGWRGGVGLRALSALVLAGTIGLEAYLTQWVRHGNPVWPASVTLGPLHLPGTISVEELLSSGANTEKVHGPLWQRVVKSWTALDSRPVFDMRVGGLGLLFWGALPLSLWTLLRTRRGIVVALLAASIVTPDPAIARYILAFPGILLATAMVSVGALEAHRRLIRVAFGALAAASLVYALPGLTGEGPPLLAYARMSWPQRRVAVGPQGRPVDFVAATDRLRKGDVGVFDAALSFPYFMWRSDLSNRVVRVPDAASEHEVRRVLRAADVRLIAAGVAGPTLSVVREQPSAFVKAFTSPENCEVYQRR